MSTKTKGRPESTDSAELAPFPSRLKKALADPNISEGILDFQRRWREKRDESIALLEQETGKSFRELAGELREIKAKARSSDKILQRFIQNAEKAGSKVIQSTDAKAACNDITKILKDRDINLVVKSKSMLTEEIFLNSHLENNGITPVETDLGQWILQIGNEHPSHLVLPAVHKRRHQIAELYERVLNRSFDPDDIETLAKVVRPELRKAFLAAGAGITGGNVLVAETGSIGIVTNEGNANLTAGLANVHIAVVGVDKLVETLNEAFALLRLLSKSGTGQLFTTYVSFLTGPRKSSEPEKNREQFIVLVDNGRSTMAKDEEFDSALGCIRCGACANVCPPYQAVGGHAFGHIYTGAIGLVNTAFHHLESDASGPAGLCVSCGACASVCPVDIPLRELILLTRERVEENIGSGSKKTKGVVNDSLLSKRMVRMALYVWSRPRLFRAAVSTAKRLSFLSALAPKKYDWRKFGLTSRSTSKMSAGKKLAREPLAPASDLDPNTNSPIESPLKGKKVILFMQCISDQVAPDIATATARLIAATGAEVVVPPGQHCCGLPALDAGDIELAKKMAKATLEVLAPNPAPNREGNMKGPNKSKDKASKEAPEEIPTDLIVTPAKSCAITMTEEYERLTGRRLEVLDIVDFLSGPGKLPDGYLGNSQNGQNSVSEKSFTAHQFCQRTHERTEDHRESTSETQNSQNGTDTHLNRLISQLTGTAPEPLEEAEFCCGFGGFTSMVNSDVSNVVLNRKMDNLDKTNTEVWVTDNPGCALHVRGGAKSSGREVDVLHISEFLANKLPEPKH